MYKLTASITINIFLNLGMAAVSSILTTTEITLTRNSEARRAGRTVARKFSIGGLHVCSGALAILEFDKKNSNVRQGPIYVKLNVELTRKNDKATINGVFIFGTEFTTNPWSCHGNNKCKMAVHVRGVHRSGKILRFFGPDPV